MLEREYAPSICPKGVLAAWEQAGERLAGTVRYS